MAKFQKFKFHIILMNFSHNQAQFTFCCSSMNAGQLVMLSSPQTVAKLLSHQYEADQQSDSVLVSSNHQNISKIDIPNPYVDLHENNNRIELEVALKGGSAQSDSSMIFTGQIDQGVSIIMTGQKQIRPISSIRQINGESASAQLEQECLKQKISERVIYKEKRNLSNFTFVNHSETQIFGRCNNIGKAVMAMLNQDIGQDTQKKIICQLKRVLTFQQLNNPEQDFTEINRFMFELTDGMSRNEALQWIVNPSIGSHLINSLLKQGHSVTEIFYLQPFFKILFNAVYQTYKQQKLENTFTCFWDEQIDERLLKKLNNGKNQIIENLSFIIASNSSKVQCRSNKILFQVQVNMQQNDSEFHRIDNGFVIITDSVGNDKIVFNPLNFFQVIEVSYLRYGYQYHIKLRYISGFHYKLVGTQKIVSNICLKQRHEESRVCNQGKALTQTTLNKGVDLYFCKKLQLIQDRLVSQSSASQKNSFYHQKAEVLILISKMNSKRGKFRQALQYLKKAKQSIINIAQWKKKQIYFENLELIAICYHHLAQFHQSFQIFIQLAGIRQKLAPTYHYNLIPFFFNIGILYMDVGMFDRSKQILEKCSQLQKSIFGEDNIEYIMILNNLANINREKGSLFQSLIISEKCIKLAESVMEGNHPLFLRILHNFAQIQLSMRNFKLSLSVFQKCFDIRRKIFGDEHPQSLQSFRNLGLTYQKMGKYREAEQIFQRTIQVQTQIFGIHHPQYLSTLNNLGICFQAQGEIDEAFHIFCHCIGLQQQILGKYHPNFLNSLGNLSILYLKNKNIKQSIKITKRCMKLIQEDFSQIHPEYIQSLNRLGASYQMKGELRLALKHYNDCLFKRVSLFGRDHPYCLRSIYNISFAFEMEGKLNLSMDLCSNSLKFLKKVKMCETEQFLLFLKRLAQLNLSKGNLAKSSTIYRHCLAVLNCSQSKSFQLFIQIIQKLALVYMLLGNIASFRGVVLKLRTTNVKNKAIKKKLSELSDYIFIVMKGNNEADFIASSQIHRSFSKFPKIYKILKQKHVYQKELHHYEIQYLQKARQNQKQWKRKIEDLKAGGLMKGVCYRGNKAKIRNLESKSKETNKRNKRVHNIYLYFH